MQIITGSTQFHIETETAVAIGKFDGVHVGHRRLLQEILAQKACGRKACVFTFDPPPAVFFGKSDGRELTTKEEKRRLFEALGIDILVEFPMNKETAATLPAVFVKEILCEKLHAGCVAAGTDLSFGAKGAGNAALLCDMSKECGIEVHIIEKIMVEDKEISSSLVREAVEKGDVVQAEKLLGAPYQVSGVVQHGNHIGRTLGMPTVNVIPTENKLLPPCGVYYTGVKIAGTFYKGISNIGYKPTVKEEKKILGVETYLYDYNGNAYGEEITVSLYEFKRPEQKFVSLDALKAQMQQDIQEGAAYSR